MFRFIFFSDYEATIAELASDNDPTKLRDQLDELDLIIKYLCEHAKVMDRNYLKSHKELDAETQELQTKKVYFCFPSFSLKLKIFLNAVGI